MISTVRPVLSNIAHLSAKNFKLLSLYEQKSYYASAVEAADEYAAKADTAQSRDVRKSLEDRRDESLDHASRGMSGKA